MAQAAPRHISHHHLSQRSLVHPLEDGAQRSRNFTQSFTQRDNPGRRRKHEW